jgi:hypothetical protein
MSPAERESTDKAFGELLDQFRRAEIQRMEPVAAPAGWLAGAANAPRAPGMSFDSALIYHIPDLSGDIPNSQTAYYAQLFGVKLPGR